MEESDSWCFTVLRTNGLRLMRPEKSWRPIVAVEVDEQYCHETVMGVDGQNPNLKEQFHLHQAHPNSRVSLNVWYRSQSKKKSKKRTLVATASHSLGELLVRQEREPRAELEVRLNCKNPLRPAVSSRGKPQNGATILLKIRPPPGFLKRINTMSDYASSSDAESSTKHSPTFSSPTDENWPDEETLIVGPRLRRRRQRKLGGYHLNSGDEVDSCEDDIYEKDEMESIPFFDDELSFCDEDRDDICLEDSRTNSPPPNSFIENLSRPSGWIAVFPSLLPQYTETIPVPNDMSFFERMLSSFTMYNELKQARLDSHYEKVFTRLQTEWTYTGGLLVALAAVDTAVFTISPGSVFQVKSYAQNAIAASSVASGLGIACDAWFLLRYNWADLHTFIHRARDLYSSYFFFSLSARVPALCLFASALSLMVFMGTVAFNVWPLGVLFASFIIGLAMSLQFLIFGAHWCALRTIAGVRRVVVFIKSAMGMVSKESGKEEVKMAK